MIEKDPLKFVYLINKHTFIFNIINYLTYILLYKTTILSTFSINNVFFLLLEWLFKKKNKNDFYDIECDYFYAIIYFNVKAMVFDLYIYNN